MPPSDFQVFQLADLVIGAVCLGIGLVASWLAGRHSRALSTSALVVAFCVSSLSIINVAQSVEGQIMNFHFEFTYLSPHAPIGVDHIARWQRRLEIAAEIETPVAIACQLALCATVWRYARRKQTSVAS
jgi:hypothetical protein